jgi:hypothetical protein
VDARVGVDELSIWASRKQFAIAVDESQLLDQSELHDVIAMTVTCQKGAVIATEKDDLIGDSIISAFLEIGKQVIFIHMRFWKSGQNLPDWEVKKRITSDT